MALYRADASVLMADVSPRDCIRLRQHVAPPATRDNVSQEERNVVYHVNASGYDIWVPAAGATPNFVFSSCNGMSGDACGAIKFADSSASVC